MACNREIMSGPGVGLNTQAWVATRMLGFAETARLWELEHEQLVDTFCVDLAP